MRTVGMIMWRNSSDVQLVGCACTIRVVGSTRNRYVAHMSDHPRAAVDQSIDLEASVDEVLAALTDPDVLSAWLGRWTVGDDGDARVVTDDGVTRRVEGWACDGTGVRWTWSPDGSPGVVSEVVIAVHGVPGFRQRDRVRVTVRECVASRAAGAPAAASPVPWLPSLMALGAVLALGSVVPV